MIDFTRLRYTENIPYTGKTLWQFQFARIYTSSLINIEKILTRPITKFSNSGDLKSYGPLKQGPLLFLKKHLLEEPTPTDANKELKTKF